MAVSDADARHITVPHPLDRFVAVCLHLSVYSKKFIQAECARLVPQGLEKSALPRNLRMIVLGNRANFEFRAFQVSWQLLELGCAAL